MTIADARNWCNAQVGKSLDFDGLYGAQCFDFFNFYYQFITSRNPYSDGYSSANGVDGAKDIYGVSNSRFAHVANNPNDPNQLPPDMAIMILNQEIGGGYGHVQVADHADTSGYWAWEQNWAGPYVEHRYHTWRSLSGKITGWLVFNGFNSGASVPEGDNVAIIGSGDNWVARANKSFIDIRGRAMGPGELTPWIGKDFLHLVEALEDNPEADANANAATVGHMAIKDNWQQQIYDLQDAVAAANADDNATKAQLQAALAKVTDMTNKLAATIHPPVTSSTPVAATPVTKQPDSPSVDWGALATNLWNSMTKFITKFKH